MKKFFVGFFIITSVIASAQVENKYIEDGNSKYEDNDYTGAQQSYEQALEKNPLNEAANYNLGNAQYKQQKFDEALTQYQRIAESTSDPALRAQAYHNLGNAYLEQQKFDQSVNAYKNALRSKPDDADTKYNLAYAQKMLKQQQQQNQQQNQQQDQKDEQQQQKNEPKNENNQNQQKQQPKQPRQFSKDELDRILQALNADDKNVQDKINRQKEDAQGVPEENDW
jgi:tetratricopeptide (TPR) repeat protein